jgi:hypothetical protein
MKGTMKKMQFNCQKFSHIAKSLASITAIVCICSVKAEELNLNQLNHNKVIATRGPSSFIPNDEIQVAPEKEKSWMASILVPDDAGVLNSVKSNLDSWQATEDYAKTWNLESTGLYTVKSTEDKKEYLNSKVLKYFDKRLSGEIKKSEKGSTLRRVATAQKALRPKAAVAVSQNIKVKFKAKVLQGKAMMKVDNPYVDYNAEVTAAGEMNMKMAKSFKDYGVYTKMDYDIKADQMNMKMEKRFDDIGASTHLDYDLTNKSYLTYVDKQLSQSLKARVSSSQSEKEMAFTENADKKVQLFFNTPF